MGLPMFREDAQSQSNTPAPTVAPPATAHQLTEQDIELVSQLGIGIPIQQNIAFANRNIDGLRATNRRETAREVLLAEAQQYVVDRYLTELQQQLNDRSELPAGEDAVPRRTATAFRDRAAVATYREHLERRAEERVEGRQGQRRQALTGTRTLQEGMDARRERMQGRIVGVATRNQRRATTAATATAEAGRMDAGVGASPIQRQPSTTLLPPVEQMSTAQLVRRLSTINEPETSQPSRRELELTPWASNIENAPSTARQRYEAAYRRLDNSGATGEERLVLQMLLQRAIDEMLSEERDAWF
ncbi:MAG: hypothetical protein M1830_010460 [Pleopsidium flavum]|nr:MAG: hypothetical protein M1830_010460 [Pleopsidium flavum]